MIAITLFAVVFMPLSARADTPNCDSNAVVWCGANSTFTLINAANNGDKHNSGANIAGIYAQNSISVSQIGQTVDGSVTKSGNVVVNGKIVATNAQSVGRQNMPGSTAQGEVWIRPTSVSFASDSLQAFVLMQDKQFVWAIIKACGNPVLAKPVVAVTAGAMTPPLPPPPPVMTPPPPPPTIPKTGSEAGLAATIATPAMWLGLRAYRKSRHTLSRSLLK